MKLVETDLERPSFWQLVFSQSKVNGALYNDEELPGQNWNWPKDTYLPIKLISAINSLPPSRAASFSSHGKSGATEAAHRIQWQKGQAQKAWPFFPKPSNVG